MNLKEILDQYFDNVINWEEYTIVVDGTGVYFFTSDKTLDDIVDEVEKILYELDLQDSEAKFVRVNMLDTTDYDSFAYETSSVEPLLLEVNLDNLEDLVRKLVAVREVIFEKQDIDSIIDCFYDTSSDTSPLELELVAIGVDPEVANKLSVSFTKSNQDILEFGVDPNLVSKVSEILENYYGKTEVIREEVKGNNYVTIVNGMKHFRTISVILFIVTLIVFALGFFFIGFNLYFSIATVLLAIITIINAVKSLKLKDNLVCKLIVAISGSAIVVATMPHLINGIVIGVQFIVEQFSNFSLVDQFRNLHW